MDIIKVESEINLIKKLSELIENCASNAINENGVFRVGLSGGSLSKYLASGLPSISTDWEKWELFFCDERFVPETDEDSTFGTYKKMLIPKTLLKESQFFPININLSLVDCAKDYEYRIRRSFNLINSMEIPKFDLLLLGMGPDGHTCSLFPNHKLLDETNLLIAPISDSPKPPPERVTMTYTLLNNAHYCIFPISGSGKADMIKKVLKEKQPLPAERVKPHNGKVIWLLDSTAAVDLTE